MGLKELLQRRAALNLEAKKITESISGQLEDVGARLNDVEKEITALLSPDLSAIRKLQEKEFGAVHITRDDYRVTETIPKKVKWDQEKLFGIYRVIRDSGDDPFAWMKAEWKVGEKEFNTYPREIQSVFAPARTVTPGDPKIEFKPLDEGVPA
jgi:hypothetical protein